jgi:phosphoribosyl 1,2-cyclic phosphodiesterase
MTRLPELRVIAAGDVIDLGFLRLEALPGSHDAADPLVLAASEPGGARLGLATDLGTVTGLIRQAFRDLDALILEFNHDPEMLINGPYPLWLKQRVRGRTGHLSNEAAAEALAELNGPRLGRVVLAHLSEVNNTPKLALAAARGALPPEGGPEVRAAGQWVPTAVFDI